MQTVKEKLGLKESEVIIKVNRLTSEIIQAWCFSRDVDWSDIMCGQETALPKTIRLTEKRFLIIDSYGITYTDAKLISYISAEDFIEDYNLLNKPRLLWFCEDSYYTTEQVESMISNNIFSPFISTKQNINNWTEFPRVQVTCTDNSVKVFVKVDSKEIFELKKKLEKRLNFLNGLEESWK